MIGKIILPIVFSVLLLVPIGAQQVFANHPGIPTCPPPGFLINDPGLFAGVTPFCQHSPVDPAFGSPSCSSPYVLTLVFDSVSLFVIYHACVAAPVLTPDPTLAAQCQNNGVLVGNHCEPDLAVICSTGTIISGLQCIAIGAGQMIGGTLLEIDKFALIVAAIGIDPLITGLVALTIVGVTGQAAWFIHRRKKKNSS